MSPASVAGLMFGVLGLGALAAGVFRSRREAKRRYGVAESLHELRGSLTAIQLGTDALEANAGADDGVASRVDALRTQIERATEAVEDLCALVLPGAGRLTERTPELVEIGEIVRRRGEAWDRLAFTRGGGVELRWSLPRTMVRADSKRLCQALDNLIANGLDHGGGIVTLEGRLEDGAVHIAISDQGPGIARPLTEVPRAAWHASHGHGLAIVRRAVELHRGRLTATPQSRGTNVEIELPLAS
jgi:signal transduction histidine kinase